MVIRDLSCLDEAGWTGLFIPPRILFAQFSYDIGTHAARTSLNRLDRHRGRTRNQALRTTLIDREPIAAPARGRGPRATTPSLAAAEGGIARALP